MRPCAPMPLIAFFGALAAPLAIAACTHSPAPVQERVIGGGASAADLYGYNRGPIGQNFVACAPQTTTAHAEAPGRAFAESEAIRIWTATVFQTHGEQYSHWPSARDSSVTCGPGNSGPGTYACTATGLGCIGR